MMPLYEHDNWGDLQSHTFMKGTITSVDPANDTVNVTVPGGIDGTDVPLFYHCDPDSEERDNGAIEGAAGGFSVDDEVIVMCTVKGEPVRVVGFVDGIKACARYVLFLCPETRWCVVWNIASNEAATDIRDINGAFVAEWPIDYQQIYLSWRTKQVPKPETILFQQTAHDPPDVPVTNQETTTQAHGPHGVQQGWVHRGGLAGGLSCTGAPNFFFTGEWWDPMMYSETITKQGNFTTEIGTSLVDSSWVTSHKIYFSQQLEGLAACLEYHVMSGGKDSRIIETDISRTQVSGRIFTAQNGSGEELKFVLSNAFEGSGSEEVLTNPNEWTGERSREVSLSGPYLENISSNFSATGSNENDPNWSSDDPIPDNASLVMGGYGEYAEDEGWMYQVFWRKDLVEQYVNEAVVYDVYASAAVDINPDGAPTSMAKSVELTEMLQIAVDKEPLNPSAVTRTIQGTTFQ